MDVHEVLAFLLLASTGACLPPSLPSKQCQAHENYLRGWGGVSLLHPTGKPDVFRSLVHVRAHKCNRRMHQTGLGCLVVVAVSVVASLAVPTVVGIAVTARTHKPPYSARGALWI
jgi:hypothetical protein